MSSSWAIDWMLAAMVAVVVEVVVVIVVVIVVVAMGIKWCSGGIVINAGIGRWMEVVTCYLPG